jgi:ribosomal-protein-serine acetyltransferase
VVIVLLPQRAEGDGVLLRRWTLDDLPAFHEAVTSSVEHLRPWMPWIAIEPQTIEQRAELIRRWEQEWRDGHDVVLGIFHAGRVAGGCGLHRRRGPGVLEIGYWLRPDRVGRGIATTTARVLTTAAFSVRGIDAVEIHHDKANTRSAAVPRRLGYRFVGERDDEVEAPGQVGVDCTWRIERSGWVDGPVARQNS